MILTLLFFLRSPAGNTDAVTAPQAPFVDYDDTPRRKRDKAKEREERKAIRSAERQLLKALKEAERKKLKRKRDTELLMMLFLHEFDGYDD
jgi:hypothetical protein